MRLIFLAFIPLILADSSEERIQKSMERLRNMLHRSSSNPRSVSSVSSATIPFGPFGMISMMARKIGDEEDDDLTESMERKLEDSMSSLKDKLKSAVSEMGSRTNENDSPLSGVSTFTDVISSLFGKLASTLGEADPFDRRSPFGLADTIGTSLTQLKGPHICVREINRMFNADNKTKKYSNECKYFSQAMKCKTTRVNEEEARETIRVQECCDGFSTDNIRSKGCNKETEILTPETFLEKHNISSQITIPKDSTLLLTSGSQTVRLFPQVFNDFDLEDGEVLTSAQGEKFVVKINLPEYRSQFLTISLNCIPLAESNIQLTTGKAHFTSEDIRSTSETVLDLLEKDGRFKKFLSILSEETVAAFSNKSTSQTVLPFTDEAFEKFPKFYQEQINNKMRCFASGIARAHIFQPAVCYSGLSELVRGIVRPINADLVAFNGIVHVVDDLIVKEDLEPVQEKLKNLAPAMARKLENKIDSNQPMTLFVPISLLDKSSDETEGSGQEGEEISEEAALNQIVPWFLPSIKALPPTLTTMGNTTIFSGTFGFPKPTISLFKLTVTEESRAQIGCSRIVKEPCNKKEYIGACGASIFFIDKPIPKVEHNLSSLLKSRPDLNRFNELMSSFLEDNNALPRVVTLISPVDDAFSVNNMKRLKENGSRLSTFVKRHLIPRPLCEQDFQLTSIRPLTVSNKNGEHLKYKRENGELYIEDAKILETIVVSNGVVHIVDSAVTVSESSTGSFVRFNL